MNLIKAGLLAGTIREKDHSSPQETWPKTLWMQTSRKFNLFSFSCSSLCNLQFLCACTAQV